MEAENQQAGLTVSILGGTQALEMGGTSRVLKVGWVGCFLGARCCGSTLHYLDAHNKPVRWVLLSAERRLEVPSSSSSSEVEARCGLAALCCAPAWSSAGHRCPQSSCAVPLICKVGVWGQRCWPWAAFQSPSVCEA